MPCPRRAAARAADADWQRGTDLMRQPRAKPPCRSRCRAASVQSWSGVASDIALADAGDERLALLPWNAEPLHLPGAGRDEAAAFAGQSRCRLASPVPGLGAPRLDLVDAQPPRHFVEEDVAGVLDAACAGRHGHGRRSSTHAMEGVVAEPHRTGAIDGEIRRDARCPPPPAPSAVLKVEPGG